MPELSASRLQWLRALDRDPSALRQYLGQQPNKRLGIYFEKLWHFFLREDPDTELIAHNLPVHQMGKTQGEFDCLYFCRQRQRAVHLELAVKFYLCSAETAPSGEWHAWIGPNCRDRMDLKLAQMTTRQIRLGETPAGKDALDTLKIADPLKEIALKGYLFRHPGSADPLPPDYNRRKSLSHWLRAEDLELEVHQGANDLFRCLRRTEWLAPANAVGATEAVTLEQLGRDIGDAFEQHAQPRLIAQLDENGQESVRFFVVPTSWPSSGRDQRP